MRLTKLEDIETLKPFDCGDDDLNEFLTVDAYRAAVPFYEKNGFKILVNEVSDDAHTVPMYYDLKQLVNE